MNTIASEQTLVMAVMVLETPFGRMKVTMAANGVPMPEIQFVLRHQAMTTTNGYIRRLGFSNNPLEGIFGGERPAALETAVNG